MASTGFDTASLQRLGRDLLRCGEAYSKKEKKFLRQEGSKLLRKTKKKAKRVGKKTGNYQKSIKRGKLHAKNGALRIRVYSGDPIAHLIEDGWTPKARDGSRGAAQDGKGVFEKAFEAFAPDYEKDAEEMIDEMIRKI